MAWVKDRINYKTQFALLVPNARDTTAIFRPNQASLSWTELYVFHPTARAAFYGNLYTFDLDEGDLQSEGRQPNDDEKRISEKAGEDVSFPVNLAGVHLVEKGHLKDK